MSLRAAINGKCRDCIYDSEGRGTWREQVGQCTIVSCSLWKYRPRPTSYRAASVNVDGKGTILPLPRTLAVHPLP